MFYSPKVPYELVCHQPTSRYPYPNNIKLVFFLIVLHIPHPLVCISAKTISDCKQYVRKGRQVVNWSVFLHFPFVCWYHIIVISLQLKSAKRQDKTTIYIKYNNY